MIARRETIALLVGAACWLCGCSLMDLGNYDIQECKPVASDTCPSGRVAACARQNKDHGITDHDCLVYQCRMDHRGCELGPRDADGDGQPDAETCGKTREDARDCDDCDANRIRGGKERADRLDNDCDEVIDEGVLSGTAHSVELDGDGSPIELASFAGHARANDPLATASVTDALERTSDRRAFLVLADGENVAERGQELLYDNVCSDDAARPCPGLSEFDECDFQQLALTRSGEQLIGAGVSRLGFDKGRLRIGLVASDLASLELGAHRSGITLGVGADLEAQCCGSKCCDHAEPGVRHAVLAGLELESGARDATPQALAIWVAAMSEPTTPAACETGPSSGKALQALGVVLRDAQSGVPAELFASDAGRPICFGEMTGDDAPALVAWSAGGAARGFLAGYPNANHALELAIFDPIEGTPPAETERDTDTLCQDQADRPVPTQTCGSADDPAAQQALTLADPTVCQLPDFGSAVQAVAIAPARSPTASDQALALLVAVRSDCGTSAEIRAGVLMLDAANHAHCAALAFAPTMTLRAATTDGAQVIAGPAVAYVPKGFLSPDRKSTDPEGGWFVVWVERDRQRHTLRGVRVSERDQRVLDAAPLELARDISSSPIAIPDAESHFFFGGVNRDTATLVLGGIQYIRSSNIASSTSE